jgi:phage terminase small subunit
VKSGADGLTVRQQAFVQEYMIDLNATQAYIRAGYSPRAADVSGPQLLGNPRVADAIARAKADRAKRTGITADRVLRELAAVGFARLPDVARWGSDDLTLTDSDALADDDARAIQSVTQTEKFIKTIGEGEQLLSRERTIKLHDKVKALTKLGDHLGIWQKEPEPQGEPMRVVIVEDE